MAKKKKAEAPAAARMSASVVKTYTPETVGHVIALSLKRVRIEAGMNQKEFAAKLGIAPGSVTAYEGGRTLPNAEALITWMKDDATLRDLIFDTTLGEAITVEE